MAPVLPTEICYSIIQSVDAVEDLLDLSLCCSAFRKEAQRLLFRHPVISTHEDHMYFVLVICTAPTRLGPLVHSYTMEYNPGPEANIEQETAFIAFALSAMCNLKQIEHGSSTTMPLKVYVGCKALLDSFNYYRDSKTTPDISALVYDVLPLQPSITHMIIHCSSRRVKIGSKIMKAAADLCPNLMSLSVSSRAIGKMLIQRKNNLRSLQWTVGTSTPIGMTLQQYNHLNYLMMWVLARGLDTSFAKHLGSLTFLELYFDPSWDEDILKSEMQYIAEIPDLQYLMIYSGVSITQPPEDGQLTDCPQIARNAFMMQKSLRHIDIGPIREHPAGYLRIFGPLNEGGAILCRVLSKEEADDFRIKHALY